MSHERKKEDKMKLFKKLMAGAMAIAMLSVYTVAFATGTVSGSVISGSSHTVSGAGSYAGGSSPVFLMKLPTAAGANTALAFTVDPQKIIENSPPTNTAGDSTYGTVIFSTASGANVTYKNESAPLKVVSMSSVDVTVNMIATLTDTKMTLSTTSGFSAAKEHLYLAVKVATVSGGTATAKGTEAITGLCATDATVLKAVPGNFKTTVSGGTTTLVSGAASASENAAKAADLPEDSWSAAQYTVIGASNPAADWQIANIKAPNLTIKWVIDPSNEPTYALTAPTNSAYSAKLDKAAYKANEIVTLYVKPTNPETKPTSATLTYVNVNAAGKTTEEKTKSASFGSTAINGVYSATFAFPNDMSKSTSPTGDTAYHAPTWEVEVG
jgi:hypothetical protein